MTGEEGDITGRWVHRIYSNNYGGRLKLKPVFTTKAFSLESSGGGVLSLFRNRDQQ